MRKEISLLKDIESVEPLKAPSSFIQRVFDDVILEYKSEAYHSIYHKHVLLNGYPLPSGVLKNGFYIRRKRIESDIRSKIEKNENIVILGCEGSGKTTIIHRVVGTENNPKRFLYIDTSDLGVDLPDHESVLDSLISRMVNSISHICNKKDQEEFEEWITSVVKGNSLKKAQFENKKNSDIVSNYIYWLNSIKNRGIYIILDNIDSLSAEIAKRIFIYINQINASLDQKAKSLTGDVFPSLHYIVSCRTTTYRHISSVSSGIFINSKPKLVIAEDKIRDGISIPQLMKNFLLHENPDRVKEFLHVKQSIPIFHSHQTLQVSFKEYIDTMSDWLLRSESAVNSTIKPFCGRSIRRMKLYGLRAYTNPLLASLSHLEKQKVVNISRDDPKYLKRRIVESLFDFRVVGSADNETSIGFPLNLFRVIYEHDEFRRNPILGIVAINILQEKYTEIAAPKIHFAQSIFAEPFLEKLIGFGYSENAIRDLMMTLRLSGILRPISDKGILLSSEDDSRNIYKYYILDERAVSAYYSLLNCDQLDKSIQYFNAAVRYKYNSGFYARVDNLAYECLLNLIFLDDMIDREKQFYNKNKDNSDKIRSLCCNVRGKIIPFWERHIVTSRNDTMDRRSADGSIWDAFAVRLKSENERMFKVVSNKISECEVWI